MRESHVICKDWIFSILLSGRADDGKDRGKRRGRGCRWSARIISPRSVGRERPEIKRARRETLMWNDEFRGNGMIMSAR